CQCVSERKHKNNDKKIGKKGKVLAVVLADGIENGLELVYPDKMDDPDVKRNGQREEKQQPVQHQEIVTRFIPPSGDGPDRDQIGYHGPGYDDGQNFDKRVILEPTSFEYRDHV